MATRDLSRKGERFIDFNGLVNEIEYSVLTPLGYHAFVSVQGLKHLSKHPLAARHQDDIPYILNNPDLILRNYEFPTVHLYYKVFEKIFFVVAVHQKDQIRFVATLHDTPAIKGLKERKVSSADFLYIRGGFKWKRWK